MITQIGGVKGMGQEMSRTRMFQTMIMMLRIQSLLALIGIQVTPSPTEEHGLTGSGNSVIGVTLSSIHLRLPGSNKSRLRV